METINNENEELRIEDEELDIDSVDERNRAAAELDGLVPPETVTDLLDLIDSDYYSVQDIAALLRAGMPPAQLTDIMSDDWGYTSVTVLREYADAIRSGMSLETISQLKGALGGHSTYSTSNFNLVAAGRLLNEGLDIPTIAALHAQTADSLIDEGYGGLSGVVALLDAGIPITQVGQLLDLYVDLHAAAELIANGATIAQVKQLMRAYEMQFDDPEERRYAAQQPGYDEYATEQENLWGAPELLASGATVDQIMRFSEERVPLRAGYDLAAAGVPTESVIDLHHVGVNLVNAKDFLEAGGTVDQLKELHAADPSSLEAATWGLSRGESYDRIRDLAKTPKRAMNMGPRRPAGPAKGIGAELD